jgi:RNA polymerase sigma factor (sigma-70 family)
MADYERESLNPEPKSAAPLPEARNQPQEVERLFREHNSALLRFIRAKVGSEHEAREIAQEAYVHLLRLDHPEAIGFLRAFLFKTAANLAVDRLRQRSRRSHVTALSDVDSAAFELSPERQLAGEQTIALLGVAVRELPPRCQMAFLMHKVHGVAMGDIAQHMGIGKCMVRRYIARALEHLRYRLDMPGESAPESTP